MQLIILDANISVYKIQTTKLYCDLSSLKYQQRFHPEYKNTKIFGKIRYSVFWVHFSLL